MVSGLKKNIDPKEAAKIELSLGATPMIVLRELPNGKIERWKVSELINFNKPNK
jgi:hypothetical protein